MTNIKEFKDLLKMKQEDLHEYLCEIMPSYYEEDKIIDQFGSFLYCEGTSPVLLVAHLDTVHKMPPRNIFFDEKAQVMWSPEGIGGDDRCGVWSILEILDRGYLPSIVFTWNEEIGALGASDFCDLLNKEDLKHVNFAIEIDRKGTMDCVFYDLESPEFEKFIAEHNYKTALGSFSDISTICPHFEFAGVNLSAGYFSEHTLQEHIDVLGMEYTIERVCNILDDERTQQRWEWIGTDYSSWNKYGSGKRQTYGYWSDWDNDYDYSTNYDVSLKKTNKKNRESNTDDEIMEWCTNCSSLVSKSHMAPKPYDEMCKDCYKELKVTDEYCQSCGSLTGVDDLAEYPNELICKKCYNELLGWNEQMNNKDIYCEVCGILDRELDMYENDGKLICRECFEETMKASK